MKSIILMALVILTITGQVVNGSVEPKDPRFGLTGKSFPKNSQIIRLYTLFWSWVYEITLQLCTVVFRYFCLLTLPLFSHLVYILLTLLSIETKERCSLFATVITIFTMMI